MNSIKHTRYGRHSGFRHGGRSLGVGSPGIGSMIRRVESGFDYGALERFQKASGMPMAQIAELLRIPPRTMVRRRASGKLDPNESERLLRIAAIFEKAVDLFEGDATSAMKWLTGPKKALGGEAPIWYSRTEVGAREVEALIGRLEHGVFS